MNTSTVACCINTFNAKDEEILSPSRYFIYPSLWHWTLRRKAKMDFMLKSIVSNPAVQGTRCADRLLNEKDNIFRMFDSSGKFPSGLASGNLADLGSFDECLTSSQGSHYCTVILSPRNVSLFSRMAVYDYRVDFKYASILIGACAPVDCKSEQIQAVYQTAFSDWFVASVDSCQSTNLPLNSLQQAALLILGSWMLLMMSFLLVVGNGKTAQRTSVTLAVMKSVAILWVILGHTYAIVEPHIVGMSLRYYEMRTGLIFCLISNAHVSVEIFFCITGILIAKKAISRTLFNSILGIVIRYIRLTIPAMITLVMAPMFPLFCNGPASMLIMKQRFLDCFSNWWAIPTHMNNLRSLRRGCMPHLWYISADLQIFLIIWPLHCLIARKRHRMLIIAIIGVASVAYVLLECLVYGYAPTVMSGKNMEEIWRHSSEIYQRPITHVASVAIGYLAGCLHESKMLDVQQLGHKRTELYLISIATMVYSTFGGHPWISGTWDYLSRPLYPAFYAAVHRPLFALGIAVLYLLLEQRQTKNRIDGQCAKSSSFLKTKNIASEQRFTVWAKFPVILSRLTFSIYITHIFVVMCTSAVARERLLLSHSEYLKRYILHVIQSIILGGLFYVCVEVPLQRAIGLLMSRRHQPTVIKLTSEKEYC